MRLCGGGTTIDAAERLGRDWIGIDVTPLAISLIKNRLQDTCGSRLTFVSGSSRRESAPSEVRSPNSERRGDQSGLTSAATEQGVSLARIIAARPVDQKKGAGHGIDGKNLFRDDQRAAKPAQIIIQVKGGKSGVKDVRDLRGVFDREQAAIGIPIPHRLCAGLLGMVLFASLAGAMASPGLEAPEVVSAAASSPSNRAETEDAGPERLKEQTRVTVETNVPPAAEATATNAPSRQFDWDFSWRGWDGLHISLTRKTLFGQQISTLTKVPVLRLDETRMAGKLGAKLALDAAAFVTDDEFTGFDNGAELRRARLYAKGDCLLVLPVSYELEVGYVPSQFYLENSFIEFHKLGFLGSLKVGQYQVPMSLVNYGSSRDMTFMEPATVVQALAPGVNAGFQMGRPVFDQRMTWAFGLFTDSVGDDFGDATEGFGRAVARVTGLPLYQHEAGSPHAQRLLHLGLSGTALYAGESTVRYRSRPESHLAPFVLDTGETVADGAYALGAEAAWVNGPLCVQGEYLHSWVQGEVGPAIDFGGFYAQASWLLTGESRPYDRTQGTFARLVPKKNFNFGKGGWGAWEIAGRYSFVDLNSDGVGGGKASMFMAGVNWYLHSHVKWRFNYGFGRVSGRTPEGNLNLFQTRVEMDF